MLAASLRSRSDRSNKQEKKKKREKEIPSNTIFNTAGVDTFDEIVIYRFSNLDIMTTTNAAANAIENSMFNIQYPNCQRGMYSLRQPFKDMKTDILPVEPRPATIRNLTPAAVQPTGCIYR